MRQTSRRRLWAIAVLACLPGCMRDTGDNAVTRFLGMDSTTTAPMEATALPLAADVAEASPIIAALQQRQSAIRPGTPYARVAQAVMASDARVAEAELRVAQLRSEAAQKNWMPRIGPRASLTSLGDVVAQLVVEQVIFDNGRMLAERDKAKADVELAAVTMVEDGNARVFEALSLYLLAEEGRDSRAHFGRALNDMSEFEWIMERRVQGGVSDRSDLTVLRQKLGTIRARRDAAEESTRTALAELRTMTAQPMDEIFGLGGLTATAENAPLGVLRAEAEREVSLASARIQRAGYLPGLAVNGSVDRGGNAMGGLEITSDSLFGLGTMAELNAIEVGREAAGRRVAQAQEAAAREIASQTRQIEAYRGQLSEARLLTVEAKRNLDLFQRQYEGGQRQVMDVVGVYETYSSALEKEIDLRYKAARAELDLARLEGALAEGARM